MHQLTFPLKNSISRSYLDMMKWLALIAMTFFHVHYSTHYSLDGWPINFGRIAFPIFAFILAWNIAAAVRENKEGVEKALMRNLLAFACFAQPFHWTMVGNILPLNVLFTLALGTYLTCNYRQAKTWVIVAFLGYFVDYGWFGVLLVFSSYFLAQDIMQRRISIVGLMIFSLAMISVSWIIDSFYPMLTIPIIMMGIYWQPSLELPRCKWFFYVFYPAHLAFLTIYSKHLYLFH